MTDDELEAELRRRAEMRGCRLVIERSLNDQIWRAEFKTPPSPGAPHFTPEGVGVMSAESPHRREALDALLFADDTERERGRVAAAASSAASMSGLAGHRL